MKKRFVSLLKAAATSENFGDLVILGAFLKRTQFPKRIARLLFNGKGDITALRQLGEYLYWKGEALHTDAMGNKKQASALEKECRAIYDQLPTYAREAAPIPAPHRKL